MNLVYYTVFISQNSEYICNVNPLKNLHHVNIQNKHYCGTTLEQ